jgi:hypothetical protein
MTRTGEKVVVSNCVIEDIFVGEPLRRSTAGTNLFPDYLQFQNQDASICVPLASLPRISKLPRSYKEFGDCWDAVGLEERELDRSVIQSWEFELQKVRNDSLSIHIGHA